MSFTFHHVAITVKDFDRSTAFYEALGFEPHMSWDAPDGSRRLRQLKSGPAIVELFAYPDSPQTPPADARVIGLKHIAFSTTDLDEALTGLLAAGLIGDLPEIVVTDFGTRLCFVTDPDGVSIELVER